MAAKVLFRSRWTCSCVATSLPWVELDMIRRGIIRESIDVTQYGWNGSVSASAGTHDEGGCIDVLQFSTAAIDVWRLWGWTMQRRDLTGVMTHGHGWPYGCPHLAPAAQSQQRDWDRRDAGLVGGGRVVGRWPVKQWEDALRERKMGILQDIETAAKRGTLAALEADGSVPNIGLLTGGGDWVSVVSALAGLARKIDKVPTAVETADAVLRRDGVIENPDATSPNTHIALATAVKVLAARQEAEVSSTKQQIDGVSKLVVALQQQVEALTNHITATHPQEPTA